MACVFVNFGVALQPRERDELARMASEQGHTPIARWLERSCGWRPLHLVCDARRGRAAIVALLRAGADPARPSDAGETPLSICTLADAAAGALPEDPYATAVVREALRPWHPARHWLSAARFRARVGFLLLLWAKLEARDPAFVLWRGAWTSGVLPFLPPRV